MHVQEASSIHSLTQLNEKLKSKKLDNAGNQI